MNTLDAIKSRRSIRKYRTDADLPQADLEQILEAGMLAPSACDRRAWEFVVVRSQAVKEQIMALHPYTQMLKTAPLAVVVCGRPDLQDGIGEGFWPQDCAAVVENMLLAAVELGYGGCWCGCYPKVERAEQLRALLGATGTPVAVVALGVPDEAPKARGFFEQEKVRYL